MKHELTTQRNTAASSGLSGQSSEKAWFAAYGFALLIVPLIGAGSLLYPFGRDQGIHATIAFALDEGLVTYRDVFNIKPPLTTAMHWLSQILFGHSMTAIRALDLCAATATALGIVFVARRLDRSSVFAFAAPFAFAVLYYSYSFWHQSQTDGWAGFLVVAALACMATGWQMPVGGRRRAIMAGAGMILGLAFAFKYTIGGAGILVFAPLLAGQPERFSWSDVLFCTLGGLAVLGLLGAIMAAWGALAPFWEIQQYMRGYLEYSKWWSVTWGLGLAGVADRLVVFFVALGLLATIVGAWQRRAALFLVTVVLWTGAAWLSGQVQGKGFKYHFLPLIPPYAMLIAAAVEASFGPYRNLVLRGAVTSALLLGALYLTSDVRRANMRALSLVLTHDDPVAGMRQSVPHSRAFDAEETVEFAKTLGERREESDSLFVWGWETMLYFLVEEPPRYRYPFAWPFAVDFYDGRYTDDLLARLAADPPQHFVVQKKDATAWITNRRESSDELLKQIAPLHDFLQKNYWLVNSHPRFDLYELRETHE